MASADVDRTRWGGSDSGALATLARHQRTLWTVVVVALLTDTLLTAYGLSVGMFEANPVMRASLAAFGPAGLLVPKAVSLSIAVPLWALIAEDQRAVVPATLATPWLVATAVNLVGIASL